jgi:hypothetical protein
MIRITLIFLSLVLVNELILADLPYMPYYQETDDNNKEENDPSSLSNSYNKVFTQTNKEFWDQMYQNSMINKKTKYDIINGGNICLTCPIDRNIFNSLYNEARVQANITSSSQAPPKLNIGWTSSMASDRVTFFCRNNSKVVKHPIYLNKNELNSNNELEYICEENKLCLINVKSSYPHKYQCLVKSHVLDVQLNVVGKLLVIFIYSFIFVYNDDY